MTRTGIALTIAALLLVAACSDDTPTTTAAANAGGQTTVTEATPTTATDLGPAIPVDPSLVPDGDPNLLAALVFFPDEIPAPYDDLEFDLVESGYSPAGGSLASALDAADEADDIVRFGQVAEFSAAYGDPNVVGVAFNAAHFATPEGAEAYLNDWVEDLRSSADSGDSFVLRDFHSTNLDHGDQSIRIGYTSHREVSDGSTRTRMGGAVAVREGNLVLWVWGNGDQTDQILDDFHQAVAERVAAVANGDILPRDYAELGLTDPPTLALDSYVFRYEYGVEAPEGGFSVVIAGEFEGPDRTSCRTTITIDGFEPVDTYLVAAGTRVWLGDLTGYDEVGLRDPAALNAVTSCPGHPNHWDLTKLHRIQVTDGEEVEVSGVSALRDDLFDDPEAMREVGYSNPETDGFTRYELTVAVDGGWPIQLDVERQVTTAAAMRMYGLPTEESHQPDPPRHGLRTVAPEPYQ